MKFEMSISEVGVLFNGSLANWKVHRENHESFFEKSNEGYVRMAKILEVAKYPYPI